MTETFTAEDQEGENVVTRGNVETMLRAAARAERPKAVMAGRAMYWTALLICGALTILPIARFAGQELETWTLVQSDNPTIVGELARGGPSGVNTNYAEALAEFGLQPDTKNHEAAFKAAERATKADASRAGAWAELAFLEYSKGARATPAAIAALDKSMNACPVCDQDLVRWRFNFVLANWADMPEDMRKQAFEHADILRWIGQNREFLGEMRVKAQQAGIPFDSYRSGVKTPVRSFDLGPGPTALNEVSLNESTPNKANMGEGALRPRL